MGGGPSSQGRSRIVVWGSIVLFAVLSVTFSGAIYLLHPRVAAEAEGPRAAGWLDPRGDVTLPNADLLGGSITIWAGQMDIRVRVAKPPYPEEATHFVTWCLDTDSDASTGTACGSGDFIGADAGFTLFGDLKAIESCNLSANGFLSSHDIREMLWYHAPSRTLRLLVPQSVLEQAESFRYVVESVFGGSFGANDRAPQQAGFLLGRGSFSTEALFLPFVGTRPCAA